MRAALILQAAVDGDTSMVEMLLLQGARVDATDDQGFTPLLAASYYGHTEVCKLLLETGKVNVKETTPVGFTPLLVAVQKGHTEVCELLLANGSDLEETQPDTQFTALHYAAIVGNQSVLELLLSHKANVNSRERRGWTALQFASQEGHLASVVALLQAGADPLLPTIDGALPIHQAANRNHPEVVRILIGQSGCSIDQVRNSDYISGN